LILLAKRFQRFFRNQPIRNKNGLWRPGLLTDKYEMSNLGWKVLYKDCSFRPDLLTNVAARGNYCFWLVDFYISSFLKLFSQMNWNLVESISEKIFLEINQSETRIACGGHVC
jgi:hypothetical protein